MAANASVQVDAADGFGILITNGEFTAFVDPNFGQQVANMLTSEPSARLLLV